MINAGKYNKKIEIVKVEKAEDGQGFKKDIETSILTTFANVKVPSGYTLILNNTDFEKATTNFTIRKPKTKNIERNMLIYYKSKKYSIEYIRELETQELELQAKEVSK